MVFFLTELGEKTMTQLMQEVKTFGSKNRDFYSNNFDIIKQIKAGDFSSAKRFTGFGGMRQSLLTIEGQRYLRNFLTEDEINGLVLSASSAYFTPKFLIDFVYGLAQKCGFTSGKILEPSCGNGAFFEHMPERMRKNSNITGVELEPISAKIVKNLYPDVKVINQGFQKFNESGFDLIVGNPPYASMTVQDENYPDLNHQAIHHYFVAKSVRLLKEGGLLIMVLPLYVLDNVVKHARKEIATEANLMGAYRLPDTLFQKAKITVDVVILQKGRGGEKSWIETQNISLDNGQRLPMSSYFVKHPEHVLGKLESYEIWLASEKRMRRGLKCVGSVDEVKRRLVSLLDSFTEPSINECVAADAFNRISMSLLSLQREILQLKAQLIG